MIWKTLPFILALSIAINIPFVAMWARHGRQVVSADATPAENVPLDASDPPPSKPPSGPPSPEFILRQVIGVSDEQWAKMERRQRDFQEVMRDSFEESRRLNVELMDLVAAPATNLDAIRSKQDEIIVVQRRVQDLIVNNLLADKQDLTEQQQTRLFEMLRKFGSTGPGGDRDG